MKKTEMRRAAVLILALLCCALWASAEIAEAPLGERLEAELGFQAEPTPDPADAAVSEAKLSDAAEGIAPTYQADFDLSVAKIRGSRRSVATSGCGAVCAYMVISFYDPQTGETPETLLRGAYLRKWYRGDGLSHDAMYLLLTENGVRVNWLGRKDEKEILRALQDGVPVIANMGPGIFTKRGHYILLKGLNDEGKLLINDPASEERSATAYDMKTILDEARAGKSFAVCREKESA